MIVRRPSFPTCPKFSVSKTPKIVKIIFLKEWLVFPELIEESPEILKMKGLSGFLKMKSKSY